MLGLLRDCVLYDCSDGLLPDREDEQLSELEFVDKLDCCAVLLDSELLVELLLVDGVLHELCEDMLVQDVLDELVLDVLELSVLDDVRLLAVHPSEDRLHEGVELLEDDALEQLALDAVQPPELSEHDRELLVEELEILLALEQLKLEDEWLLSVELVLGVDQLLDSVEIRVLQLGLDDSELPDDWARLSLHMLDILREDSLLEEDDSVLVLGLNEDGLLQLKLDRLDVDWLLTDDGDPELESLMFSISMIWRTDPSGRFGPE